MLASDSRRGAMFMLLTTIIFASQDGLSTHLAEVANTPMIVMIRYWFFALFVLVIAKKQKGTVRAAASTTQPVIQILRGVLLSSQIIIMVLAFEYLGLVEAHAVFAIYPLIIGALSAPVLGERVGWRRWLAIGVGFVGVMVILQPGQGIFSPYSIIPLVSASIFALYGLLNRYAARKDDAATSFFWTGTVGAVLTSVVGVFFLESMSAMDWLLMACLCVSGAAGHFFMIKAYEAAEASAIQPLAYLQLVFASFIGVTVFGETIRINVAIGVAIIVAAGVFSLYRERVQRSSSSKI